MKKSTPLYYDDEIDLIALFKIIRDGKKKILLITIISLLVGLLYIYISPISYLNSLTIKKSNDTNLNKILRFEEILFKRGFEEISFKRERVKENNILNSNELIFKKFIDEFSDYEEFLFNLEDTKIVKNNLSQFNNEEKKK